MAWLCAPDTYDSLCCQGYVSLAANPEICAGVDTIARLVGSMTIHLMENREDGDVRILNELSRKIDIEPNAYMTRADFVHWIVRTMYLEGNGNAVVWPRTRGRYYPGPAAHPFGLCCIYPGRLGLPGNRQRQRV
ncbi:phage portal protein [Oscillibacter sp.]|uniref:phage portal protein n=1 Tax=Oscillibacter sp. TaxID=1945593 RepID=UPI00257F00BD|nr:phage portal protein [Oscillibacter sp.]